MKLKLLNKHWAKDKNAAYNLMTERIQKSIDTDSFITLSDDNETGEAEDKNYKYILGNLNIVKHKK